MALPLIGTFIKNLNFEIQTLGLQKAMFNCAKKTKTKLIIKGVDTNLQHILKNESVLLIANHPHAIEPMALIASLPSRDNIFLIINSEYMNISSNLDKYLIPVYIQNRINKEKDIDLLRRMLRTFHPRPFLSAEQEQNNNIKNILMAAKKLDDGGLVIIFPGKSNPNKSWYKGVGHLVKQITNKNTYIIKCYISGTSQLDYLRLIPAVGKFLHEITLTYSAHLKISNLKLISPNEINSYLELDYKKWMKSLYA
jgi:hypothetical protein